MHKDLENHGINYQPQLVSRISFINSTTNNPCMVYLPTSTIKTSQMWAIYLTWVQQTTKFWETLSCSIMSHRFCEVLDQALATLPVRWPRVGDMVVTSSNSSWVCVGQKLNSKSFTVDNMLDPHATPNQAPWQQPHRLLPGWCGPVVFGLLSGCNCCCFFKRWCARQESPQIYISPCTLIMHFRPATNHLSEMTCGF